MKKKLLGTLGTFTITVMPISAVVSCNNSQNIETKEYNDFNTAYHDLWYGFKNLYNVGNGVMKYKNPIKVKVGNEKISTSFTIKKGNTRDQIMKTLDTDLDTIEKKLSEDILLLTVINKEFSWNFVVLSRMGKNTKYDLDDNKNTNFPRIIAAQVTKMSEVAKFDLAFELSDGAIIKNTYHMQTGFQSKTMVKTKQDWHTLSWTKKPTNATLTFQEVMDIAI